ncbi:hypothetical protein MIR68_004296 [Amoeboaphelidium protococcarum]|nr:hypothetical protein MIR68_004296 [Amoeboaphelidium protococcarum]
MISVVPKTFSFDAFDASPELNQKLQSSFKVEQNEDVNITPQPNPEVTRLVIQFGSHSTKCGLSVDALPIAVPSIVARRVSSSAQTDSWNGYTNMNQNKDNDNKDDDDSLDDGEVIERDYLDQARKLMMSRLRAKELRYDKQLKKECQRFNADLDFNDDNDNGHVQMLQYHESNINIKLASEVADDDFLFGQKAVELLDVLGLFYRRRLFVNGCINPRYQSLEEWRCDLAAFICGIVEQYYNGVMYPDVILVVDEFIDSQTVEAVCDVLFQPLYGLGVKTLAVINESVAASFGCNMSSACVVDVGFDKIGVACIDDGLVLKGTSCTVTNSGSYMMQTNLWNIFKIQNDQIFTGMLLPEYDRVSQLLLTLDDQKILGLADFDYQAHLKGNQLHKTTMKCHDEGYLAALCLFINRIDAQLANQYTQSKHFVNCLELGNLRTRLRLHQLLLAQDEKKSDQIQTKDQKGHLLLKNQIEINVNPQDQMRDDNNKAILPSEQLEDAQEAVEKETVNEEEQSDKQDIGPKQSPLEVEEFMKSDAIHHLVVLSILSSSKKLVSWIRGETELALEDILRSHEVTRIKRMFANIKLVGSGLSKVPNSFAMLEDLIYESYYDEIGPKLRLLPSDERGGNDDMQVDGKPQFLEIETVAIVPNTKNVDPGCLQWKGACIAASLESFLSMSLFSAEEYQSQRLTVVDSRWFPSRN